MDLKLIDSKDFKNLRDDIKSLNKTNENLQEVWMTSEEAAMFLKISKRTLQRYRESGKLAFAKDSRMIWFKKSDLVSYLNGNYCSVNNISKKNHKL